MAGHGSPPPQDRALNPSRVVTRDSGMHKTSWKDTGVGGGTLHEIEEYRPPQGSSARTSDRGTRYRYQVIQSNMGGGVWSQKQGDVKTLQRAQWAARSQARRLQTHYQGL